MSFLSSMPQISIITPVYNGLPYFKECLESVLAQDFQDWELVISDNRSTDGTVDYLRTLRDPRIRIFEQPVNLGIFGNLNFIFKEARAPLSQILCADDYFLSPSALGQILDYWRKQPPELGFARCNWGSDMGKCPLNHFGMNAIPKFIRPRQSDLFFFIFGCIPGNLSNVSLRTSLVREQGWFRADLPYGGDFEFWSRAARSTCFAVEDTRLVYIRAHQNSGTNTLNRRGELVSQLYEIVGRLFTHLEPHFPPSLLKLHATVNYDAQQRSTGVLNWLRSGSKIYLEEVNRRGAGSKIFFGAFGRWLVFLMTGGGRLGRVLAPRLLLWLEHKSNLRKQ